MQTPEDFAKRLREREIDYVWDGEDETKVDDGFAMSDEYAVKEIAARDAEWQARVDTLLEDNNRSEEQVKKQFANAVGFKARAEKAEARVDRLTAALKQYANRDNWELDEEHNTFRRWLEPDSYTPYAYNGFSIARAALAESEAAHG